MFGGPHTFEVFPFRNLTRFSQWGSEEEPHGCDRGKEENPCEICPQRSLYKYLLSREDSARGSSEFWSRLEKSILTLAPSRFLPDLRGNHGAELQGNSSGCFVEEGEKHSQHPLLQLLGPP